MNTRSPPFRLVEDNRRFDGSLVSHGLQALAPLLELVSLVYNSLNPDLAAIEIADGSREHVGLREGTDDSNLITEDFAWGP